MDVNCSRVGVRLYNLCMLQNDVVNYTSAQSSCGDNLMT